MSLLGSIGSLFGVKADSLLAPVTSALSGFFGQNKADERQESANAFSAQQFATRYQTTVKDMQAAGLNPMLAYSQGGGTPPSSAIASANMPDVGASLTQAKMATAQVANIEADTKNKVAQADLIAGQAAQAWATAGQANANVGLINQTVEKVKAEIDKIKGDTNFATQQDILKQTAWMLQQQGVMYQEKGMSEGQSRALMQQTIRKLGTEIDLNKLNIDAAKALDNIGRISKELQPIAEMMKIFLLRK
jgi:hypothetical protein